MARVAAAVAAALCVLPAEARLARLKDLGPMVRFELGKTVHAAGEPGVGHKTVDEFVCNGFNCHHMKLDGATCTHDPAALEESLDFVWTCEEHVAGDHTSPSLDSGLHGSVFVFTPLSITCDSNVAESRGLAWVPLDTMNIRIPGVDTEDLLRMSPDSIAVDTETCRIIYTVENLGAQDEHLSLVLLMVAAFGFTVVALCPASCFKVVRRNIVSGGSAVEREVDSIIDSARNATEPRFPGTRRRPSNVRAEGNRPSRTTFNVDGASNTFAIDGM
ncbi:hypothetical protein DIPPA_20541 [Diplonema papillatum]|nr:hypothetical protein DIPPA_20541 [Diplonema papillatum]